MKRCEVWWVNFDPSIGGEIKKKGPAVIVSNDAANTFLNRVQVVPLTSRTDRVYPREAVVVFEGTESKAMADQLATVSEARLFRKAGILYPLEQTIGPGLPEAFLDGQNCLFCDSRI
jgi:mRNA interferase MazF